MSGFQLILKPCARSAYLLHPHVVKNNLTERTYKVRIIVRNPRQFELGFQSGLGLGIFQSNKTAIV